MAPYLLYKHETLFDVHFLNFKTKRKPDNFLERTLKVYLVHFLVLVEHQLCKVELPTWEGEERAAPQTVWGLRDDAELCLLNQMRKSEDETNAGTHHSEPLISPSDTRECLFPHSSHVLLYKHFHLQTHLWHLWKTFLSIIKSYY